jgi:hypothetical protein
MHFLSDYVRAGIKMCSLAEGDLSEMVMATSLETERVKEELLICKKCRLHKSVVKLR